MVSGSEFRANGLAEKVEGVKVTARRRNERSGSDLLSPGASDLEFSCDGATDAHGLTCPRAK